MDTHKNAPLTPKGREVMVRSVIEGGLTKAAAALQFNVSAKTVAKWVKRFHEEGVDGLRDRSSRPLSSPSQTLPATCAEVEALRRQRHTGKQIATEVGISPATVSRILRVCAAQAWPSEKVHWPIRNRKTGSRLHFASRLTDREWFEVGA
jgi:transposase-like protein